MPTFSLTANELQKALSKRRIAKAMMKTTDPKQQEPKTDDFNSIANLVMSNSSELTYY